MKMNVRTHVTNTFLVFVTYVFLANLFFSSFGMYDIVFGLSHSIISLVITIGFGRIVKKKLALMAIINATFENLFSPFLLVAVWFSPTTVANLD